MKKQKPKGNYCPECDAHLTELQVIRDGLSPDLEFLGLDGETRFENVGVPLQEETHYVCTECGADIQNDHDEAIAWLNKTPEEVEDNETKD